MGLQYVEGIRDFCRYLNEQGGIQGRQVEFTVLDYEYKIPKAMGAYKKLRDQYKVTAVLGWGTGDSEALAPLAARDRIPVLTAAYSESLGDGERFPYSFIAGTSYTDQVRIGLDFIRKDWLKWNIRPPKVCFIYPDNQFGKSPIPKGRAYAQELGIDLLEDQVLPMSAISAMDQMRRVKAMKADYIILQSIRMPAVMVTRAKQALGLNQLKMVFLNWAIGEERFIEMVGTMGEGIYGVIPYACWGETDLPGIKLLRTLRTRYHPQYSEDRGSCRYIQGQVAMRILAEALKAAGPDLTGPGIKAALEKFKGVDIGGLSAPVTYTAKDHRPNTTARIFQIRNQRLAPVTPYLSVPRGF
jgi:branched-chain amino acid transport system substrate-binding protein